jgi:plasmid stabilization system protein ParE
MYILKFSKLFKEDVKSSVNYIRLTLQNPIAADRLKNEIKIAYKKIKEMPYIYPAVPNEYLGSIGFRFTMVKNYMLFYTVEEKQINIIRFLYGYRDWINILQNTKKCALLTETAL